MTNDRSLTLLHLSDLQIGRHNRFGGAEALLQSLGHDLDQLQEGHRLQPDLLVITGDLAETGSAAELAGARKVIEGLLTRLGLAADRLAVVPGNHDVSRDLCRAYFARCTASGSKPEPPYWPKWGPFVEMLARCNGGLTGVELTEEQPWFLLEIAELRVVVAGMNSTIMERHGDGVEHYGWLGERQLRWFKRSLQPYVDQGWLRIGALHHNVRRGPVQDSANLRDADLLRQLLGDQLNLLLHGHTHDGKLDWLDPQLPILATGSAGIGAGKRPEQVPNQYQVVRVDGGGFCRWARCYAPDRQQWIGDNRATRDGEAWIDEQAVKFLAVGGTFARIAAEGGSPFVVGRPIERDEDLYGRDEQRELLLDAIARGQSVQLLGERRMGKTSLLRWVARHARRERDWPVALVDLQLLTGDRRTPEHLVTAIATALGRAVPQGTAEQILERLTPVIVLVDEADELCHQEAEPYSELLTFCRGLGQDGRLVWISASQRDLAGFFAGQGLSSPFLNDARKIWVGQLATEPARSLVEPHLDPAAVTAVLDWAAGFAYGLQWLGDAVLRRGDADRAGARYQVEISSVLTGWWRRRSRRGRELLKRCLHPQPRHGQGVTATELKLRGLLAENGDTLVLPGRAWHNWVRDADVTGD